MFLPISFKPPKGMIRTTCFLPFPRPLALFPREGVRVLLFFTGAGTASAAGAAFGASKAFPSGAVLPFGVREPLRRCCPRPFRERGAAFSSFGAASAAAFFAGFSGALSDWFSAAVRTKPRWSEEASFAGAAGFLERPERL